jgi:hypothetical protein
MSNVVVGSTVNYKYKKGQMATGIVTNLVKPKPDDDSLENHGCIEVWLKNKRDYGCNNCEHFSYIGSEDFLTHIKDPVVEGEIYVGKVLKTKYGTGLIVDLNMSEIYVFLYDDNYDKDENCEDYDLSNITPSEHESDEKFNKSSYCLELKIKDLKDYLV